MDVWDVQEDYTIHTRIGYGSKYDEEEVELHICCDCMDKIIDKCVISPLASQASNYKLVADEATECGFLG
jgi:hypothetical protein